MRITRIRILWGVFIVLVAVFILSLTPLRNSVTGRFEIFPGSLMIALGVILILTVAFLKEKPIFKIFVIIAGASAAGWPASLFLNHILYPHYPAEGLTYVLFFLIFPLLFIAAVIGSVVSAAVLLPRRSKAVPASIENFGAAAKSEPIRNQEEDLSQAQRSLEEETAPGRPGRGLRRPWDYAAAISAAKSQHWPVWVVSGITFLNGAWAIAGILLTRLPQRADLFFPFGVYHWTRSLTLVFGFILVYLSFHLYQRNRAAWWAAVLVSAVSVIPHAVHWRTSYNALAPALTLILLLLFGSQFSVKSESRNIRIGLALFFGSLLVALIYGTVGFWMLDQRDFGLNFTLYDALVRTLHQFFLLGNSDLAAESRQARWFLQSLNVLGVVAASFAVYSLFRPIVYRLVELPQERAQAGALLEKYGKSTMDYYKVWSDKTYFFGPRRQSFISYRAVGGVAFCLADPVGPDETEKEKTIQAFLKFCTENGWIAVFMIPDEPLLYNKNGLSLFKVGEEAIVNLERFASTTSESKYFRYVRRKIEGDGYSLARYDPPISDPVLDEIQEVSDKWLTLPHHREYGFLQGKFEKAYLKTCKIYALRDKQSKMVSFINESPSYKPGEATFDEMRHIPGLHWGAMDYLFLKMMVDLRKEGYQTFNFGVAPFVGIGKRNDATLTEKAVNQVFERLDGFVHAKGLRQYKLKFEPEWKDSYIAYQGGPLGLLRIALNIGRIL
jgi:phosphatidylglycerol lysyltransferase